MSRVSLQARPVAAAALLSCLCVQLYCCLRCCAIRSTAACSPASALLDAQVKQLAWDGQVSEVCSLGGGPPAALLGALADRLLLARGSVLGSTEVSARHVSLLPCLLLGWASLAACAILPGAAVIRIVLLPHAALALLNDAVPGCEACSATTSSM